MKQHFSKTIPISKNPKKKKQNFTVEKSQR